MCILHTEFDADIIKHNKRFVPFRQSICSSTSVCTTHRTRFFWKIPINGILIWTKNGKYKYSMAIRQKIVFHKYEYLS